MMRRVVTCVAIAAALVVIAVPSSARTVSEVIPLGGSYEGSVPADTASTVGILIPAGAHKVSVSVKLDKKSGLDPLFRVYDPDGAEITPAAVEAAGGKWKVTTKKIDLKHLPVEDGGLFKFVLRGRDGTSGDFELKSRGKPAKFSKVEGSIGMPDAFAEYAIDVPDGTFLTVDLAPAKKSELVPDLSIRTAGGRTIDLAEYREIKKGKTKVKKLPLPFFGRYILEVTGAEGTGDYTLKVKIKAKKIKPDDTRPTADAGDGAVINPEDSVVLSGAGSPGATFAWERVSGQGNDLTDADTATPGFTAGESGGTHAFQLVTTLNGIDSIADTAVVEVNLPPVAVGGPSFRVSPDDEVTLDGSESFDLDSDADLDYEWQQVSGPAVTLVGDTTATATFTAPSGSGVMVFELTVNDGSLASVADRVVVGLDRDAADAGRPVVVAPGDSVWLSGLRTPGTPGSFTWSRVDTESADFTLDVTDGPFTAFSAPRETGTYRFRLEVAGGGASADEVIVIVSPTAKNGEPRADAGGVTTAMTDSAFQLSGGSSEDPDDDTLAFEWRQVAGADAGLTGSGATPSGTTPAAADILRILLMVSDGRKYSPPDQVTIAVGSPTDPIANAWLDVSGAPGDTIALDANRSLAAAGRSIVSVMWEQVTGLDLYDVAAEDDEFDATSLSPSFTVPETISSRAPDRSLLFSLVVTDDTGATSGPDTVVVTFTDLPSNAQPEVTAEADADIVRPDTLVTLTGDATDRDGDLLTYLWEQTAGPVTATLSGSTTTTATLTAPGTSGEYVFRLTVSDGTGAPNEEGTATARFSVNTPPTIVAVASPPYGPPGTTLTLDGSGTTDADGDTLTWHWEELPTGNPPIPISGLGTSTGTVLVPPYAYGLSIAQRTRKYRLTVRDPLGAVTADVSFIPNVAPTTAGMTVSKTKIRYDATDAATFTLPTLTDADGDTISVAWRVVTGPTTAGATLSAATGATTSLTVALPSATNPSTGGVWVVGVTLKDGVVTTAETQTSILAYPSFVNDVFPMLVTTCATAGCHTTPNMANAGGLDLSTSATAYGLTVGVAPQNTAAYAFRVKPNDHKNSWLWVRVNNGSMPRGGTKLTAAQLNIIRDWIEPEGLGTSGTMSTGAENN